MDKDYKQKMRDLGSKGGLAYSKYPFKTMEIGDSFDVSEEDYFRVANAARNYGLSHNMKFQTRTTAKQTKLWRIE